jgi:large subunit ribosomal protein L34e
VDASERHERIEFDAGCDSCCYEEATHCRVLPAHFLISTTNSHLITQLDLYPTHTAAMAQRVTLRKRQPYNTSSSRRRIVKTPGGVLRYHHIKKLPTAPKCGDCGSKLSGVRNLAIPYLYAYHYLIGEIGCCPSPTSIRNCVQDEKACQPGIWGFAMWWLRTFAVRSSPYDRLCRMHLTRSQYNSIVRAFLIEEAKVVKRVIKSQQKAAGGRS